MSDYGIKVSRDGYAATSTTPTELAFNSNINTIKVATFGTSSASINNSGTITIAHGLGYVPGYILYFEVDSGGKLFFTESIEHLSGKNVYVQGSVNSTNLVATITLSGTATVKIYYALFVDPVT